MIDELRRLVAMLSQYEHLSLGALGLTMLVAIACGFAIYLLYRFFYRGTVYSDNFGVLIVMVSGITAFIIVTIGANLVLSLGMVGALSIVRFRAAIKEPLDLAFIYWGVAVGLTCGARLYLVAIVGTVVVGLIYILLTVLRKEKRSFLMVLRYTPAEEAAVDKLLETTQYRLKNKTVTEDFVELTAEVKVKRNEANVLQPFTASGKVESAVLVEYTGDYV